MGNRYNVRLMRSEINNVKNVNFGEVTYMNQGSINSKGVIDKTDIIGIYGQNGSGKTALVESIDMVRHLIRGDEVPYEIYAGILSRDSATELITDFFIEKGSEKYKVSYGVTLVVDDKNKHIIVSKEKLVYWRRGSSWRAMRELEFENPYYDSDDLLEERDLKVVSEQEEHLYGIPFLLSMEKLALVCAQQYISVFFNKLVLSACRGLDITNIEAAVFKDVIIGVMQFGTVDLNVIKVNQLGTINSNEIIPINVHVENDSSILQECINLYIASMSEVREDLYEQVSNAINAINVALKSIVPNLQIELEKKMELEQPDGKKTVKVEVFSNRDGKRFLLKYESEGIKRIISILNYLISVFNNPGVCLVVDELDSGIFEYLLGELLGLMHKELKGQLIFTSHNLRILEKLDSKNIICSTVNPDNRYIRMVGIEKNHNKRDFYIRAITVGGQKEELYDEDDLIAMGYAFRRAGRLEANQPKLKFSTKIERSLQENG